jgi:hypothetical protein
VRLNDFYDGFVQPKSLSAMTKDSHRILSSPRIPEDDLPGPGRFRLTTSRNRLTTSRNRPAPVSHLPRFVDAVRWLTGACRFQLVVSRNRPDSGKSSSGDWKIAESDFGWTKSSQKSLSRTNQMQKTTKKCTNTKIGTQTSHSFLALAFLWAFV